MRLMTMTRRQVSETGDTIVEVLIAIAIISLVLTGAYVTVNHNSSATEDTREHIQAAKVVQSQIELLRGYVGTLPGTAFCLSPSTGAVISAVGNACNVSLDGATDGVAAEPYYTVGITSSAGSVPTYTVSAQWVGILSATNEVKMYYRL